MSNMYGYSDYDGPKLIHNAQHDVVDEFPIVVTDKQIHNDDNDSTNTDTNPLQVGFWMDGDSMAPPCGTSISTIHEILNYISINENDILYDLGCGDGRICIEAYYIYHCRTIGIEVENDLVIRAQTLIDQLSLSSRLNNNNSNNKNNNIPVPIPRVYCMDLRQIFHEWFTTATTNTGSGNHDKDHNNNNNNNDNDDTTTTIQSNTNTAFPLPTIIFLYLLPEALLEIQSSLLQLLTIAPKNCRIVCNTWGIPNWKPIQVTSIPEMNAVGVSTTIYIYTIDSVQLQPNNA